MDEDKKVIYLPQALRRSTRSQEKNQTTFFTEAISTKHCSMMITDFSPLALGIYYNCSLQFNTLSKSKLRSQQYVHISNPKFPKFQIHVSRSLHIVFRPLHKGLGGSDGPPTAVDLENDSENDISPLFFPKKRFSLTSRSPR